MTKNQQERDYDPQLDSIRIIACLAVVLLHVSARPIYMQKELSQLGWMLGNALSSLTHWCVPVFVMLSGALILGDKKTTHRHMLMHKVPRMLIVLAISSAVYALWMHYFHRDFKLEIFAEALLMGMPYYHLHFFYLIIGLYIIAPSISRAAIALDEKALRHASIAACLVSTVTFFWSVYTKTYTPNGGSFPWGYIGYFILGYYLNRYKPNLPYALIFATGYIVTVIGTALLSYKTAEGSAWKLYLYTYFSPTVLAMSVGAWGLSIKAANYIKFSWLKTLAPLTLIVYITHPIFMEFLRAKYGIVNPILMHPAIEVPLTLILTTFGTFCLAFLLRKNRVVRTLF